MILKISDTHDVAEAHWNFHDLAIYIVDGDFNIPVKTISYLPGLLAFINCPGFFCFLKVGFNINSH
jgi:hypothetical protein